MAKFRVYQIKRSNRDLASQALFYTISENFTQATARNAFASGEYNEVATVEANSLLEVQSIIENDRTSPKLLVAGQLRNITVGDIIQNVDDNLYFIAAPETYDRIKIKR